MATNCSALDVAAYILKRAGAMSTMKLQKLVYYSQAWSLVWDEEALFKDKICAWANGPVVPALFAAHKGKYRVEEGDIDGDTARWLHQMVDRNEEYQRGVCRAGNGWQLHDVARRYDWIDQRIHQEEDRGPDW